MSKVLNKREAAQLLGISIRTIDSYRERGIIPSHNPGGKLVRFFEDELLEWLRGCNGTAKPSTESTEATSQN